MVIFLSFFFSLLSYRWKLQRLFIFVTLHFFPYSRFSLRIQSHRVFQNQIKIGFMHHSLILSPSPLIPSFSPQIPRLLLLQVPNLNLPRLLRCRGGWRRQWRRPRPRPRQRFCRRIRRCFGWGFRRGRRVRSARWIQLAESRQAMQRSQGVRRRSHRRRRAHLRLRLPQQHVSGSFTVCFCFS